MAGAALAEVARAALAGDQGDSRVPARGGRLGRRVERAAATPSAGDAASYASRAGAQASYIVLSPSSALPRATMPVDAGAQRLADRRGVDARHRRARRRKRRKNVPYSGPLAPPTVLTRVIPTFFSSASGASNSPSSIAATTAFIPRSMLAPWSASPIAESSSVRYAALSCTDSREGAKPVLEVVDGRSVRHAHAPQRRPGVLTGASQSRTSSSSTLSSVTEQPAISSEVM